MAETTRNHTFSKEIIQVIITAMIFGAKFLLKRLSASDFSYERKSAFKPLYTASQAYSSIIHSLFISHTTCLRSLQIVKRGMSQRSNLPPPLRCLLSQENLNSTFSASHI